MVGHSPDVVVAGELAAVGMKEEAWPDSLEPHDRLKRHFDVSNDSIQIKEVHLDRNFAADCSMEGRMAFFDDRNMQGQHLVDGMTERKALDSRMAEMECAHKVTQYSAKKDAAEVVLDP